MKKQSSADIAILDHDERSFPFVFTSVSIVPLISTPNNVPITFPTPPVRSVPPITDEAMASISMNFACATNPHILFRQYNIPPIEQSNEDNIYAFIFVFLTFNPISFADDSLPPTA